MENGCWVGPKRTPDVMGAHSTYTFPYGEKDYCKLKAYTIMVRAVVQWSDCHPWSKASCMITLFNIAKARVLHHSAFISRFYRLTCMWTKQGQDFQYY